MPSTHPKWGPDFDRYFEVHEQRLDKAFDDYMASRETTSVMHDGLIPLRVLETMLTIGDNMHEVGYQHGEKSLAVLMDTIRRYTELTKLGIFEYYYGYLLMRHVTRTVCVGTLLTAGVLKDFINDLEPGMSTVEASFALGEVAFDLMRQALLKEDYVDVAICLGIQPPKLDAFQCVGGLSFSDNEFLVTIIWENRRRLVTLLNHGMLPGFPALMFTLCEMTIMMQIPSKDRKWVQLQDIMLRSYLVGTKEERQTLRHVALHINLEIQNHQLLVNTRTDEEDAREVVNSYVNMYHPAWNYDKTLAEVVLLDIANILCQYVNSLLTPKLADCMANVARTALERIWLEIDKESNGLLPILRLGFTRRDLWDRVPPRYERDFSWMFIEADLMGLLGRVVLMITREGDKPDKWDYFRRDMVDGLRHAFVSDWIKVQDYLKMLEMGIVPTNVPLRIIGEAIKAWSAFGPEPGQTAQSTVAGDVSKRLIATKYAK
ncbi:MYND Zn-finger protein [Ceratobasidium sp. AG-Ba]|nr:MYND Zn-finger protein [Ceratobasidium sp. AG-Ba]